ncbi:MAG: glycosyltransferase, partial [Erythrobacteraceae bacterium]
NYAICIIAKNEQKTIGNLIEQLSSQSFLRQTHSGAIHVICNGCSDETAETAREAISAARFPAGFRSEVLDFKEGGKAKFWNLAVHEIIEPSIDFAIFVDADVELADDDVISDLVKEMEYNDRVVAISGWPIKDIAKKKKKTLIEKFSLRVSSDSLFLHAINGSLYVARMYELRRIWLPVPIPGEDGMLTAMIHTEGFSRPPKLERILRARRPTHYFEAHTALSFFRHEQRMAVGTTINGWLCEYFWSRNQTDHVGEFIKKLNDMEPEWVDEIVKINVGGKLWALPPRLLTWRLDNLRDVSILKGIVRAPFSLAATILNLVPCVLANHTLKQRAASSYW